MTAEANQAKQLMRCADEDQKTFKVLKADATVGLAVTCFHAQQVVEKAYKAVLAARGISFRKSHDLIYLEGLLLGGGCDPLPCSKDELDSLYPFAVIFRYEELSGVSMTCSQAEAILEKAMDWAMGFVEQWQI